MSARADHGALDGWPSLQAQQLYDCAEAVERASGAGA